MAWASGGVGPARTRSRTACSPASNLRVGSGMWRTSRALWRRRRGRGTTAGRGASGSALRVRARMRARSSVRARPRPASRQSPCTSEHTETALSDGNCCLSLKRVVVVAGTSTWTACVSTRQRQSSGRTAAAMRVAGLHLATSAPWPTMARKRRTLATIQGAKVLITLLKN